MDSLAQYIRLYSEQERAICHNSPELFNHRRPQALRHLAGARLPEKGSEEYPAISVGDMFAPDFGVNVNRVEFPVDAAATFRCGVPNVSTLMAFVANDTFRPSATLERNLPEGVEVMSLARAAAEDAATVGACLGALAPMHTAAVALNDLLLQDGVFVRVKKGVVLDRPVQILNIFNAAAPILATRRILVVVEAGAKASVLVCDHSLYDGVKYLSNQVTEIFLGEGATLDFYEMEESTPHTARLSNLYARQDSGSTLTVNGSTLVAGVTRNAYEVTAAGDYTTTRLAGMATGADSQNTGTYTRVRHLGVGGTSQQMFKYILDGAAVGSFYGTIIVDEKARHTSSSQTNRNILASDEARMYTRPQLEIYCDEVKCSHGATVGQLDARALFYMQSRGIPLAEARMLLMQAFVADVIDTVGIPALKTRLQQLIEARLSGRRTLCGECQATGNDQ